MELKHRWVIPRDADWGKAWLVEYLTDEKLCGTSLKWLCTACGEGYAERKSFKDGKLSPYSFIHGRCPSCPGDRYSIPGSLWCLTLSSNGWPAPLEVLQYEVKCLFRFYDSHPRNLHAD